MAETAQAPQVLLPFVAGSIEQSDTRQVRSSQLTTSTQDFPWDVPANGYLKGIFLDVVATGGVGASVFRADGPFNALDSIVFNDTYNTAVLGPISGWDLYVINKYGGYHTNPDAKQWFGYSANTTNGNFAFDLYVPICFRERDLTGSLLNTSSNTPYRLQLRLAASTSIYSTVPTTLPTVTITARTVSTSIPREFGNDNQKSYAQTPPGGEFLRNSWVKEVVNHSAASGFEYSIQRTGQRLRNLVLQQRDTGSPSLRTDAPLGDIVELIYNQTSIYREYRDIMRKNFSRIYPLLSATIDTAGAVDTGVFPINFCNDFGLEVGGEIGYRYLATSAAVPLKIRSAQRAAGNLEILIQDVQTPDSSIITGGK